MHEFLAREQPDVLCLQELKADLAQVPEQVKVDGYHIYWHGSTLRAYAGVSLHVRKELFAEVAFSHPDFDMESRIVAAQAGNTLFASVYVPNGGKDYPAKLRFLQLMKDWVRQVHASGKELVLCGDINIARTEMDVHPRERKPVIGQLPEERKLFEELIDDQLVDVGRAQDPANPNLFTWWAPWRNLRERNIGWRLDYVLASKSVAARAVSCVVRREFGTSDHGPVMMVTA